MERLVERLAEEREARRQALRDTLNASIEKGGVHSRDDVSAFLAIEAAKPAGEVE